MTTRAMLLSLLLLSAGCGGGDPGSGCQAYAATYCSKLFRCSASEAQGLYVSEGGCRTAVASQLGCSTLSSNPCGDGEHLDASGLAQCVHDTEAQDCVSFVRSVPASCDGDLFVCR